MFGIAALASALAIAAPLEQADWLKANAVPISAAPAKPPLLPPLLRNARVILLGEIHGLAHGQIADLALLKALQRQAGIRYYLGEFDAAQADAFNRFVETGDRSDMDAVFASWRKRGLQWANQDFRDKLLAIAQWNRTLPPSQRIRFLGADEVQDGPAFCRWLGRRLAKAPATPALSRLSASLGDPATCATSGALAVAATGEAKRLDPVTADGIAALATNAKLSDREGRIEVNTKRHLAAHRGRFYGLWGLYHVVQAEVNGTAPLALRLLRAGIDVRSMAILNLGGEMMIPTQSANGTITFATMGYTVDSAEAALVNGIEPFAANAAGSLTLFTLAGQNSPFRNSDALTRVGGRFGEMQPFKIDPASAPRGIWTDAVLISRGSPPTRPLP